MAYRDCLTGSWYGNFRYFTRKQAGCIYAAYKRGDLRMTRKQVNHMYNVVGDTEAESDCEFYSQILSFIFDKRLDLAQAMLDGKNVHMVEHEIKADILVTQDVMDNPSKYGLGWGDLIFYEVGDRYEEVIEVTTEWVVD